MFFLIVKKTRRLKFVTCQIKSNWLSDRENYCYLCIRFLAVEVKFEDNFQNSYEGCKVI